MSALGGGYFKTSYEADLALVDTRLRRLALTALVLVLLALPRFASGFVLDLVSQAAFAAIGALALNVLTDSRARSRSATPLPRRRRLHDGRPRRAWHRLAARHAAGDGARRGVLGLVVGIPSLRLKGLYLALGTLAMHHVVLYAAARCRRAPAATRASHPGAAPRRPRVQGHRRVVLRPGRARRAGPRPRRDLQRSRAGRA